MTARPAAALLSLALCVACTAGVEAGETGSRPQGSSPTPSSGGSSTPTTSSSPSASSPAPTTAPSPSATTATPTAVPTETLTAATRLDVPWGLAFLPDGSALLTLRDQAELIHVRAGVRPASLGSVPGVDPGGEGGLLGVAVSPRFAADRQVFLYFTAGDDNRVARLTFADGRLSRPVPILTGIPKARNHNGGRIAFGPDGFLYVATGDAGDRSNSQDRGSLGGKILRITVDGDPAPGNPFGRSPVWSYGHRNVQGLAWDSAGRMFASEFGQDTWDELNRIEPGRNYGWPEVEGRGGRAGLTDPLRQWRVDEASPSGIAVAGNAVYMAGLRGESLWRIPLRQNGTGEPVRLLEGRYGRLRDVVTGPDGRLWILTNNTARGDPSEADDRLVVIPPLALR